jgi:hypothetical protein
MEFLAGLSVGLIVLVLVRWTESKAQGQLFERLMLAKTDKPLEVAEAIASLETTRALNKASNKPVQQPPETPPVKTILIDGMDFEFPSDSPLNKLR